jgi:hypothetical protein
MSALPPKADIAEHSRHVRFVPKADKLHRSKITSTRSPRRRELEVILELSIRARRRW